MEHGVAVIYYIIIQSRSLFASLMYGT
jgi:hypothetical protein